MTKYRTTRDIIIPAGTEVLLETPHERSYPVDSAVIDVEVPGIDSSAEIVMNFEDVLAAGFIEEVGTPVD
jgi:hypothetical protein